MRPNPSVERASACIEPDPRICRFRHPLRGTSATRRGPLSPNARSHTTHTASIAYQMPRRAKSTQTPNRPLSRVLFVSQRQAENMKVPKGTALISITDPTREPARLGIGWHSVLRVAFDDVTQSRSPDKTAISWRSRRTRSCRSRLSLRASPAAANALSFTAVTACRGQLRLQRRSRRSQVQGFPANTMNTTDLSTLHCKTRCARRGMRPNPSLEPTSIGLTLRPRGHAAYHQPCGQHANPMGSAQFIRQAAQTTLPLCHSSLSPCSAPRPMNSSQWCSTWFTTRLCM